MKRTILLTALAGLLVAGCSSNRGGNSDQYNGGPIRGPGTGGMGNPASQNTGGTSDTDTMPDTTSTNSDSSMPQ